MRVELISLHKKLGTTFEYVTHDQEEGERYRILFDEMIK